MFTIKSKRQKNGVTLIEMMLAMLILAMAFIPIIGVMGTSAKATDKDNRTTKAIEICQLKLNKALQFPFKSQLTPPINGGSFTFGGVASETKKAGNIFLQVGPNSIDGFNFVTTLTTTDVKVNFNVPVYDPSAKVGNENSPAAWGWSNKVIPYTGVFTKYTMKIQWKDAGRNTKKFYTLVSFKAASEI